MRYGPRNGISIAVTEYVETAFEAIVDRRQGVVPPRVLVPVRISCLSTLRCHFRFECFAIDERIKYLNITGTSVNESARLAIRETQTDIDSGEKRYLAVPWRRKTGTKTMQMAIVESSVGTRISNPPSMIAGSNSLPSARCRSTFSSTTVALSTRMPTARANPPSVIVLSVCPKQYITKMPATIESGMEIIMMNASRQLPRNNRIISAVRPGGHRAAHYDAVKCARTNIDWSKSGLIVAARGMSCSISGNAALTPLTTASVETSPVLRMVMSAPGLPS